MILTIDDMTEFREALNLTRELAGYSRSAVAEAVNGSAHRIGWYESGHTVPYVRTSLQLFELYGWRLHAFGVPLPDLQAFALLLRHLRATRRLRQKDMAERVSVTPEMWARWERGRVSPMTDKSLEIMDAFGGAYRLHRVLTT